MTTLTPQKTYSLQDYQRLEENSMERHEYHDGEIIPMTGGTVDHACIISNLIFLFRLALQGTEFEVFGGDLRIWVPKYNRGLYPDLSIFQGKPLLNNDRRDEVLNPCLLVEVLSSSTEAYDRGQKFRFYRAIPSLQIYLLFSQNEPLVEYYHRRENDQWVLSSKQGLDGAFPLPLTNREIKLSEVYKGIPIITELE
ncbi:MAG: Uma2 family endonuclease [Coleofasciculaceae cyanobacterium SM2_1_6]|nr:Uma2 family endonuclease [Coleofasciculaceae cyanobacterium SM2_1_6]